ncbi:MAG: efflux RND transporter periplasmic adaptor subunit [Ignavibacteria bacterium]|nr:efflux RND transporter periplasmic adaptor subunit [Ignavibacteria bacterium]
MRKITLFVVSILLFSCGNSKVSNIIEASGIVEATEVMVSSKVASQVLKILVQEGTKVKVGDTLAILDNEYYLFQYEQAIALEKSAKASLELLLKGARNEDINLAKESLKQAEENFQIAKANFDRFQKLRATHSVSEKQFEEVELNYKLAQSRLNQAQENLKKIEKFFRKEEIEQGEANLRKAASNVNLARKYLSDCIVISPMDGVVLQKYVEVGENVTPGLILFKIAKLDTMEMVVYIPEKTLGKINVGQKVDITCDSYPDKTYKGRVVFISEEAEFTPKNIQTKDERVKLVYGVKIKIPNPNFELKSGMPADAKIFLSN